MCGSITEVTIVPPFVEVSVPVSIEGSEVITILSSVHLFEGLVEEVVQFVAAVVVTTSFTWAWWVTQSVLWIIDVGWWVAAIVTSWVIDVTAAREEVISVV